MWHLLTTNQPAITYQPLPTSHYLLAITYQPLRTSHYLGKMTATPLSSPHSIPLTYTRHRHRHHHHHHRDAEQILAMCVGCRRATPTRLDKRIDFSCKLPNNLVLLGPNTFVGIFFSLRGFCLHSQSLSHSHPNNNAVPFYLSRVVVVVVVDDDHVHKVVYKCIHL